MPTALKLSYAPAVGGAAAHLPGLAVIQAALRKTTETLARELASPGSLTPAWSSFEWLVARAVAAMHGVSALLACKLRWRGPEDWHQFLEAQRTHTLNRHGRIQQLLHTLDEAGRAQDLPLVGLKGTALHALNLYAAGERPMADVDLLVREADFKRARRMLESLGFRLSLANWKHQVFIANERAAPRALGEHTDNPLKIELHERICETLPFKRVDLTGIVMPREPRPGLNGYPSKAALMSHLLLHAAGCVVQRDLRALHLHDLALLCERMSNEDWDECVDRSAHERSNWWAFPPLHLTANYYAGVPTRALFGLAARCPRLLRALSARRTLSDVSLSHIWIHAFPGIEWSRSLSEAAQYVGSRIRPDAELLHVRRELGRTQIAAAATPWRNLSQRTRIIRWLTSRTSRVRADTLHAVRVALAQP